MIQLNHLSDKMIIYYLEVPCGYSSINAGMCTCIRDWDFVYTWWKITHPWNNIQWSECTHEQFPRWSIYTWGHWISSLTKPPHTKTRQIIVEKWDSCMHELSFVLHVSNAARSILPLIYTLKICGSFYTKKCGWCL